MSAAETFDLALSRLLCAASERQPVTAALVEAAIGELLSGTVAPALAGAVLASLRTRGETVDDVVGAVRALRAQAEVVASSRSPLVDTCGTGGDGSSTFSISTTAALVAAGAGAAVAKHGNRAATGRFGAADVLEALGVAIDLSGAACGRCLDEVGMAFLFARRLHPAMRFMAPVRAALGIRTLFNLIGPLTNPAGARRQVVGVSGAATLDLLAGAFEALGCDHVLVVRGQDGIDEISLEAPTDCIELRDGVILRKETLTPDDFGLGRVKRADLVVADATESAARVRAVLSGKGGPSAEVVVANAAAALYVAGRAASLREGVGLAREAIASGRASGVLENLISVTQREARSAGG